MCMFVPQFQGSEIYERIQFNLVTIVQNTFYNPFFANLTNLLVQYGSIQPTTSAIH